MGLERHVISKLMMGSDFPFVTWYLFSPCCVMEILMAPLDLCPQFKGNMLIALDLICSLLFNPVKDDYSADSEVTKKC